MVRLLEHHASINAVDGHLQAHTLEVCLVRVAESVLAAGDMRLVMDTVPHHGVLSAIRHRRTDSEDDASIPSLHESAENNTPFFAVGQIGRPGRSLEVQARVGMTGTLFSGTERVRDYKGVAGHRGDTWLMACDRHRARRLCAQDGSVDREADGASWCDGER